MTRFVMYFALSSALTFPACIDLDLFPEDSSARRPSRPGSTHCCCWGHPADSDATAEDDALASPHAPTPSGPTPEKPVVFHSPNVQTYEVAPAAEEDGAGSDPAEALSPVDPQHQADPVGSVEGASYQPPWLAAADAIRQLDGADRGWPPGLDGALSRAVSDVMPDRAWTREGLGGTLGDRGPRGASLRPDAQWMNIPEPPEGALGAVLSLLPLEDEGLWIGTSAGWLVYLDLTVAPVAPSEQRWTWRRVPTCEDTLAKDGSETVDGAGHGRLDTAVLELAHAEESALWVRTGWGTLHLSYEEGWEDTGGDPWTCAWPSKSAQGHDRDRDEQAAWGSSADGERTTLTRPAVSSHPASRAIAR